MTGMWVSDIARIQNIRTLARRLNVFTSYYERRTPDPGLSSLMNGFTAQRNCSICKRRTTLACSSCRFSSNKEVFVCFRGNNHSFLVLMWVKIMEKQSYGS